MKSLFAVMAILPALTFLSGCNFEQANALPDPEELTEEATGHYCQMIIANHAGPKAQIFVSGQEKPFWFPSVRDAFAFIMLPGEAKNVRAFYVNDMGVAQNWDHPETDTWTDALKAVFVIDSLKKGGMNLNEVVPFSTREAAQEFTLAHKGRVVTFDEVSVEYVFADPSLTGDVGSHKKTSMDSSGNRRQTQ